MSEPTALIVVPVSNLAGVARHVLDLARVGIPGWRLVVTGPEGPLLEKLRELDRPVVPLELDALPVPRAVAQLRRLVRSLRPAIVHSHLARADILAAFATPGLRTTLITTEHHIPPDRFMFHRTLPAALAMETVHRVRLRRFAAAIAVSSSTARDMRRWWKASLPIEVILNGVDRPQEPRQRPAGLRFLSLTRLSPEKNVSQTIRAFALLAAEHPQARLTVGGTGPEAEDLRELAERSGLGDRIAFPGFLDAEEAMAQHQVIVQPSRSDNASYTLLDAVARGMGVAASPIGGNPEILPPQCIAAFEDAALARVMVEQALETDSRPELPAAVPTVAGMAERVAGIYDRFAGRP